MAQDYLILETKVSECTAESLVNGVPIRRATPFSLLDSRPVHQYLVPGKNRFTLVVQPGPTPSEAAARSAVAFIPEKLATASLRLMSMPKGAFPDDPGVRELFQLNWSASPGQPIKTPAVEEHTMEISGFGHRWEWMSGDSFDTPASIQAVSEMLRECSDGFNRRDPEPFLARALPRFRVMFLAYGLDVDSEISKFRADFQKLAAEPGFQMLPLDKSAQDLRICADGKLVDCVDKSWEPLLRSVKRPNGVTRLRYPVKAARIGGTVQITL